MLLRQVAIVSMVLALIAAACGDDSGDSADVVVETSTTSLDDVATSTTTVAEGGRGVTCLIADTRSAGRQRALLSPKPPQ